MTASSDYKSVFLTGASSGIGREVALQLAKTSQQLWITGRNSQELQKTKNLAQEINPKLEIRSLVVDLAHQEQRTQLLQEIFHVDFDLVILNAGGGDFALFRNTPWTQIEKMIALNITANVHLTQNLLFQLKRSRAKDQKSKALVFVSSHAAFLHVPHFAVYAGAKSFLNSFAMTLMQEERDQGVQILVACPGATATQFSQRAGLPQKMLGSPKSPKDVAHTIVEHIGQQTLLIVNLQDRLLYCARRILPVFLMDRWIAYLQKKLLARSVASQEVR